MNNTIRFLAAGFLALAAFFACADGRELYRCDFTNRAAWKGASDWIVTPEGSLLRKSFSGMTSWQPQNWPDLTEKEYSVCFDVRELTSPDGKTYVGHWGFSFVTANEDKCNFFTRGQGINTIIGRISGDTRKGSAFITKIPATERTTSDKWTPYRLTVNKNGFRVYLNGRLQRCEPFALAPMAKPSFHGYGRSVEIRNFRIVEEQPPKLDFQDAPTVKIDGIVTQRMISVEKPVSSLGGGIEFWSRYVPGTECVHFLGENDRKLATFYYCGDFRIQANIAIEGSDKPLIYKRRLYEEAARTQLETIHYAFTWEPNGRVRFYLNGSPLHIMQFLGEDIDMPVTGNLMDGVKKIVFPSSPRHCKVPQQISDLRVFRRPLTNREVLAEYQRKMPIDLVFQDSLLTAGDAVQVRVTAAPGGTYMKPHPLADPTFNPAKVDFRFMIERRTGSFRGESVPGGVTELKGVEVAKDMEVALKPCKLTAGDYRLIAEVNGFYTRTMLFTVMDPIRLAEVELSKEGWKKTDLIFSRTFTKTADFPFAEGTPKAVVSPDCGAYVQCGPNGNHAQFDRIGTEVFFPKESFGKPCLLEFDWPDDTARAIGLCLHPECRKGQGPHRDSLMEGIIAGGEVRNQNKVRTTRYLFFPAANNYLFEVRTMIKNRPAAISAFRAYYLAEPLPRLKVHHPEGLDYRRFGHQDEDQTFYFLLNREHHGGTAGNLAELLRYFAYTGESTFQYSFLRYTSTFASVEGSPGNGMFPSKNGEFGSVLRIFNDYDIEFVGQFCMHGDPLTARLRASEEEIYRARGYVTLDAWGHDRPTCFVGDAIGNIANPELQDRYFAYFEDVLVRNARAGGFRAVEIPVGLYGSWTSPEYGYDDWTVRRFARDTGLTDDPCVKPLLADAKKAADYQARYALLWKGKLHRQWVKWRAERVTEFFSRLVTFIRSRCPNVKIYLGLPATDNVYEQRGIDTTALLKLEGAKFALGRNVQQYWWHLFRDNTMTPIYTNHYHASSPQLAQMMEKTGAIDLVRCGQAYFESFVTSCDPIGHRAYFQSLDMKPVGRDWLKELSFVVGVCDAQEVAIGNQQLGTLGVEDETREFVQAYSALPALPFRTMPKSDTATVVGRSCRTKNGTYFYLVNMTDEDRRVTVDYARGKGWFWRLPEVRDLSTDETFRSATFALKPYELRSFLVPGRGFEFGPLQ